jgi:hypothetical protein
MKNKAAILGAVAIIAVLAFSFGQAVQAAHALESPTVPLEIWWPNPAESIFTHWACQHGLFPPNFAGCPVPNNQY